MVAMCALKLSDLPGKEEYLYSEVDGSRRERSLRFIHPEDRLRCLAAGYMMKHCLPGYSEERLYAGEDGKPFLRNGVPFSVSHGGNYVVLAWCGEVKGAGGIRDSQDTRDLNPEGRLRLACIENTKGISGVKDNGGIESIGVDVEPVREMAYYRPILPYAMTVRERKAVGDNAREAVRIWTRKESLYKCVGEGISDFRELPEVLEDRVLFSGMRCLLLTWEEENHFFSIALRGVGGTFLFYTR